MLARVLQYSANVLTIDVFALSLPPFLVELSITVIRVEQKLGRT